MAQSKAASQAIIKIQPLHIKAPELKFSSFVTQFNDTWTPQWRQDFVYGRMDPISFYGGTDRKLTLGFRVIAEDQAQAAANMKNIESLIQYQYPAYESRPNISTIKAPPYFKLTFLNVTNIGSDSVQGYLSAPLMINPGFEDRNKVQFWQNEKLLFSDVDIVLQMYVLHQKAVGYYGDKFGSGENGIPSYPYNASLDASKTIDGKKAPFDPSAVGRAYVEAGARRNIASPTGPPTSIERLTRQDDDKIRANLATIFARRQKR
jgi:hypothetical protein